MVAAGVLRRIDRGLYDLSAVNSLTGRATTPDYRQVVDALARRDQLRLLVEGMTAANDLGLTDAIPAKVTIHTDCRRRSLQLGNLVIEFKVTAPSRLYWAGRPAMRVVQALHWLKDTLPGDRDRIVDRLDQILADPRHGAAIGRDLKEASACCPAGCSTCCNRCSAPALSCGRAARRLRRRRPTRRRAAPRRPARFAPLLRRVPDDAGRSRQRMRADHALAADCARHARMFFGSPDLGLESAAAGRSTCERRAALPERAQNSQFR